MRDRYAPRPDRAELYYAIRLLVRAGYTYAKIGEWMGGLSTSGVHNIILEAKGYLGDFDRLETQRRGEDVPEDLDPLWTRHGGAPPHDLPRLAAMPGGKGAVPRLRPGWMVEPAPARRSARPKVAAAKKAPSLVEAAPNLDAVASRLEAAVARIEAASKAASEQAQERARTSSDVPRPPDAVTEQAISWMTARLVDAFGEMLLAEQLQIRVATLREVLSGRAKTLIHDGRDEGTEREIRRLYGALLVADQFVTDDDVELVERLQQRAGRQRLDHLSSRIS